MESVCTGNCTAGSNPALSANHTVPLRLAPAPKKSAGILSTITPGSGQAEPHLVAEAHPTENFTEGWPLTLALDPQAARIEEG